MSYTLGQRLYRANVDAHWWDEPLSRRVTGVRYTSYTVVDVTPKGGWVIEGRWGTDAPPTWNKRRFVLFDARKKWAYPTKKEALESLRIRTMRRVEHLERQLKEAKQNEAFIAGYTDDE